MTASKSTVQPEAAISVIARATAVMVGGFGLVGAPLTLIDALVEGSDASGI